MISIRTINPVAHSITQMLPMWFEILSWYISFSVVIGGAPGYPEPLGVLEVVIAFELLGLGYDFSQANLSFLKGFFRLIYAPSHHHQ